MDAQTLLDGIEDLSDVELAVLLCLIAKQHCLLTTEDGLIDELATELALSPMFSDFHAKVLSVEDLQSTKRFGEAILDNNYTSTDDQDAPSMHDSDQVASTHFQLPVINKHKFASGRLETVNLDSRMVVNVLIAKGFDLAHQDVQIQTLELIRGRRIYSRTAVHSAPKVFLFLPILSTPIGHGRLNKHLNDNIYMSHHHDTVDSFPNLSELEHKSNSIDQNSFEDESQRYIGPDVVDQLRRLGEAATLTPEIRRYLQDVIVFLRLERGVDGGITPYASTAVINLAKYLAPLHGIDFVTPSLIALAVKKIYPHRIMISGPERDRSIQYGSTVASVKQITIGLSPANIIEAALAKVECPT